MRVCVWRRPDLLSCGSYTLAAYAVSRPLPRSQGGPSPYGEGQLPRATPNSHAPCIHTYIYIYVYVYMYIYIYIYITYIAYSRKRGHIRYEYTCTDVYS